jgi:hypothetical protein
MDFGNVGLTHNVETCISVGSVFTMNDLGRDEVYQRLRH